MLAMHLTSTNTPSGDSFSVNPFVERRLYSSCDTAQTMALERGRFSHDVSSRPYSCMASSLDAIGSCTYTVTPKDFNSLITSMTFELRRSGQFSLNVRPSTMTFDPLTGK